ncbi:hypothetical protein P5V34_04695 [Mycobacteroides abscessus subsp. abscessus]|jgi:hypothetical protein|uniref:hypothetical protein n=1 Tax=Mycobacteroides abscessus TaxID=36809 RepID=UPI00266D5A51|nr:hypothetical protein [Mycobacteroides abscessus]MDO3013285.1 hypothetical protein [Mycobacteroides abscessus subsp. abscessus]
MNIALPYIAVPYTTTTDPRRLVEYRGVALWAACRGALRRFTDRHRLTAQERANLATSYPAGRPAVFTAALGGHCVMPARW